MIELLRQRRSIRKYLDKEIEPEKIEILKEALLRSPSSRNIRPWRFVFVTNKSKLRTLSEAKQHGASFLRGASLGIVVCAEREKSDVWVEDCSIASTFVQLVAHSLRLGSCWIQIRKRDHNKEKTAEMFIKEALELADNYQIESIIAVGHPAEAKEGVSKSELEWDKVEMVE